MNLTSCYTKSFEIVGERQSTTDSQCCGASAWSGVVLYSHTLARWIDWSVKRLPACSVSFTRPICVVSLVSEIRPRLQSIDLTFDSQDFIPVADTQHCANMLAGELLHFRMLVACSGIRARSSCLARYSLMKSTDG